MGQNLADIVAAAARNSDEIVTNAQQGLALDLDVGLKQQIVVFDYGTC